MISSRDEFNFTCKKPFILKQEVQQNIFYKETDWSSKIYNKIILSLAFKKHFYHGYKFILSKKWKSANKVKKIQKLKKLNVKVSEYPQKLKILKATFCRFTVFLLDLNEKKICFFLTKILFLNEISGHSAEHLYKTASVFRSSLSQMFLKIVVLKNSANFTGKHLCWSLSLQACNFVKKIFQL